MAESKMINDPEFLKILSENSRKFILADRKELLNILNTEGIEALKTKLINDIEKADG